MVQSAPVHRVEPHPTIADVDLQLVAVMFQLAPSHDRYGCPTTVGRQGLMKAAGALIGLPRELRTRDNMPTI